MKILSTKSARPSLRTLLAISTLVFFTTACSTSVKKIETAAKPVERTPLNIKPARPVELNNIEWIVVTEDNAEEVLGQLDKPVIFGITPSDYERLSMNLAEIRKHISTQLSILMRYKEYYEEGSDTSPPDPENQ